MSRNALFVNSLFVALLLGTGFVAAAADDLGSSYQALKDAEAKKDPALVKKTAAETLELARKAAQEPAPAGGSADDQDAWKKRVAYAHEVEEATEYALYVTAIQAQPAEMADLMGTLEAQNPKSKYLDMGYASYLYALGKTAGDAKVIAVADNAVKYFPDNPDVLLIVANAAAARKQADRAGTYARRLIAAAGKRAKPEGMDAADWERQKAIFLGRGYLIAGSVSAQQNKYIDADKNLRAALPYLKGDKAAEGQALFTLGVVNYQYGKMILNKAKVLEAAKFSDQAAQIEGPLQHQAWLNAQVMKDDAAKMR